MISVAILGSTGSIGTSTLSVLKLHPEKFKVFALSASTKVNEMVQQCCHWQPRFAVMVSAEHARLLQDRLKAENCPTQVLHGPDSLDQIAAHPDVDVVMAAIVGAAGLKSSIAAAKAGKRLLLANKEALVVGGELFIGAVKKGGATLLPVDSEHSAIFQALPVDRQRWALQIDKIILTASGGPFRQRDPLSLKDITPEQACAHPNWVMGKKISVDSATMMNKALEVIEAKYLFGLAPSQIEVVIHPQSVVHSMVQFVDRSVLAQMGTPDMRVPIAYALSWPERIQSGAEALDFRQLSDLTFESILDHGHPERFPALALAWSCLNGPAGSCIVLNAANEVAVDLFLQKIIQFDQISALIRETLDSVSPSAGETVEALLDIDQQARIVAKALAQRKLRS